MGIGGVHVTFAGIKRLTTAGRPSPSRCLSAEEAPAAPSLPRLRLFLVATGGGTPRVSAPPCVLDGGHRDGRVGNIGKGDGAGGDAFDGSLLAAASVRTRAADNAADPVGIAAVGDASSPVCVAAGSDVANPVGHAVGGDVANPVGLVVGREAAVAVGVVVVGDTTNLFGVSEGGAAAKAPTGTADEVL